MAEMKVLLVDSDERLRGELAVMLHAFQSFRIASLMMWTLSLSTTSPPIPAPPG